MTAATVQRDDRGVFVEAGGHVYRPVDLGTSALADGEPVEVEVVLIAPGHARVKGVLVVEVWETYP